MRVLLVDSQQEVRSALRLLLEQDNRVHIVGEAEDVNDIFACVQDTHPNLLLLDWELPGFHRVERMAAVATVRALQSLYPEFKDRRAQRATGGTLRSPGCTCGFICQQRQPPEVLLETLYDVHNRHSPPDLPPHLLVLALWESL